ncbi:hypothetical protein [Kitasatospora sp. NPDC001683]
MPGSDPAQAVLAFARQVNATQIVIGATRRSRPKGLFGRGTGETIIEGSGDDIDVYVVTRAQAAHGRFLHRREPGEED